MEPKPEEYPTPPLSSVRRFAKRVLDAVETYVLNRMHVQKGEDKRS